MIAEPRVIFLVCFLAGAWFLTFALLVHALHRLALFQRMMEESRAALKLAAYILAAQNDVIEQRTQPPPDTDDYSHKGREGFCAKCGGTCEYDTSGAGFQA